VRTLTSARTIRFFNYLGTPELECFAYKWKLPEDRRYGGLGLLGRELVDNHIRAMSSLGMSNFKIAESLERNNIVNEDGNIRWCSNSVKVARRRIGLPATKYESSLWTDTKIRRQIAIEYWTESRPRDILAARYSVSKSVVQRACSKFKPPAHV
jgi:hypothetical protein